MGEKDGACTYLLGLRKEKTADYKVGASLRATGRHRREMIQSTAHWAIVTVTMAVKLHRHVLLKPKPAFSLPLSLLPHYISLYRYLSLFNDGVNDCVYNICKVYSSTHYIALLSRASLIMVK